MQKMLISLTAGTLLFLSAPVSAYSGNQPYCREYTKPVTVGNRVQEGFGTACMQPDGSWQVAGEPQPTPPQGIQTAQISYNTYPVAYPVQQPSYYPVREVIVQQPVIQQAPVSPLISIGWNLFNGGRSHEHFHHGHHWRQPSYGYSNGHCGGHGHRGHGHGHHHGGGWRGGHGRW